MATTEPPPPHLGAVEQLAHPEQVALPTRPTGIPGRERGEIIRRVIAYAVLIAVSLLFFVPLLWSLSTSFKTLPESIQFDFPGGLFPDHPTFDAYRNAWSRFNFARYTANSFILAITITLFNLFLASLGGYAFARLRFPGREVLFMLVLATLMIPDQLRLVPVFQLLNDFPHTPWNQDFPPVHWNLIGTYQGYVAINLVTAANLFLMRQYFLTIPKDFEEAAKLDGAGYFKTYWRVMLPLAGPALAAVTILQFQGTWNDFFWPLIIFLQQESKYTLTIGIAQFRFQYLTQWPELMAASIIAIIPVTVLYVFFQRYFVAGVAAAGVKG